MKQLNIILILIIMSTIVGFSQENLPDIIKALPQIEKDEFKGIIYNDSLVAHYVQEYLYEAKNNGLDLESHLAKIKFILIEPESDSPYQLTGMNLGLVNKERKLIMLSRSCLLDRFILKATLFRELSHYLGIPYNKEGLEIMALVKPKGYSYAWFDEYTIREIVYDELFLELKKLIEN